MGLATLFQSLAQTALKIAGDVAVPVTYTTVSPGTYDEALDSTRPITATYVFNAVPTSMAANEYDYAKSNDVHMKIIIAANDITFVPATSDECEIKSAKYVVKKVKPVASDAVYILYLQQV